MRLHKTYLAEIKKSNRSFAFWLSLIGASLVVVVLSLVYFFRAKFFLPEEGENPWVTFTVTNFRLIASLLLPLYVILVTTLTTQLEDKNNMWKQLFTLPVPRWHIYISKLAFLFTLVLATHLLFILLIIGSGYLLGVLRSDLAFLDFPVDMPLIFELGVKSVISVLGILIVQYWLSLRFKNFVVPISIGFVFVVTAGILINGWEDIQYFPYAFPTLNIREAQGQVQLEHFWRLSLIELQSLLYFLVGSLLVFIDMSRLNIKN